MYKIFTLETSHYSISQNDKVIKITLQTTENSINMGSTWRRLLDTKGTYATLHYHNTEPKEVQNCEAKSHKEDQSQARHTT